jgi:hypothetical protein
VFIISLVLLSYSRYLQVAIRPPAESFTGKLDELEVSEFPLKFGVVGVRGCEIQEILDEEGNKVTELNPREKKVM